MTRISLLSRSFWKSEDGTGLVEFAMAAPVFLLALFAIMELGLAAWQKNSVASDVREGARYAVVRGSASGRPATAESISAYVKTRTSLDTAAFRVYTTWSPNKRPGSVVTVSVAHNVARRGPFIAAHTDSASSQMVIAF
jgi:Flp pilus assembly protein TadG